MGNENGGSIPIYAGPDQDRARERTLRRTDAIALATDKLYNSERKTKLEIAGSEIISGLLDTFAEVVTDLAFGVVPDPGRQQHGTVITSIIPSRICGLSSDPLDFDP